MRLLLARASLVHDYGAVGAALFDIVNVQNWTRRRNSGPFKHARFRAGSGAVILLSIFRAGLAHREEHSPCKREAGGSSPPASTTRTLCRNGPVAGHCFAAAFDPPLRRQLNYALVAKRQTQPPQKRPPHGMEVQVLPGAPTIARFAKRQRHRSYTPTFPGSSPGASTNRFVSLAAKALARHAGDPRFESATRHQQFLP